MELTTESIIKFLHFDHAFKESLLKEWKTMNPDKKFIVEQLLWDTYMNLYKLRLNKNLELGMSGVDKTIPLDKDFYKNMQKKTQQEMDQLTHINETNTELEGVRSKLQALISK